MSTPEFSVSPPKRGWHLTLIATLIVAAYMFPLYWMVSTAVKVPEDLFTRPPTWIPTRVTFENFAGAVFGNPIMMQSLQNSVLISLGTTLLTLLLATPAAYALARLQLRWTGLFLAPFLIAQLLPTINLALPIFTLFSQISLVNTLTGLVLANTVNLLPFAVIVFRPFYLSVPTELEDAAWVDGANRFQAMWRVILPLVLPGMVTVGIFVFVLTWGEFIFGLTLATRQEMQPVTVTLNSFIGLYGTDWGSLMAASTIVALPIVVIFVVFQRYIRGGLAAGSVKG